LAPSARWRSWLSWIEHLPSDWIHGFGPFSSLWTPLDKPELCCLNSVFPTAPNWSTLDNLRRFFLPSVAEGSTRRTIHFRFDSTCVFVQIGRMSFLRWSTSLILAVLCFCAYAEEEMRFTKGTGDMGQFIIQKALQCGAKTVSTNDLPPLKGDWKYSEDQYGVVFHLGRERFDEVLAFLGKSFGPPAHEPSDSTDGGKSGWYSAKTIGIGLQFAFNKERTQVIVLRPQKPSVIYGRAAELAPTKAEKKLYKDIAEEAKKQERKGNEKK
jgi:hypothetical protein